MRKSLFALSLIFFLSSHVESSFGTEGKREAPSIEIVLPGWLSEESVAYTRAREEKKPLVIAFLGDGWCPWSEKWAHEMLGKKEFAELLEGQAILLHLVMKQEHSGQAEQLRDKYQVYHCPQMIAYAEDGEEIGRIEYSPMEPKEHALQVLGLLDAFREIRTCIDYPKRAVGVEELQRLYANAKKLSSPFYQEKLLQRGLEKDSGTFFLLENYASLIHRLKLKNPLVQQVRQKVLDRDPKNQQGTRLALALLDFEKLTQTAKKKDSADKAAFPLLSYLEKYGKKDRENLWKIERTLAHYYFSKNQRREALMHAKLSQASAPESSQAEIADLIAYFTSLEP